MHVATPAQIAKADAFDRIMEILHKPEDGGCTEWDSETIEIIDEVILDICPGANEADYTPNV